MGRHSTYKKHLGAIAIMIAMALSWLYSSTFAASAAVSRGASPSLSDSLTVSVITCYPGPEIYELCGHAAVRITGEGRDSVWNFGMFNFREPNFVYRFVKGETDYMCVGYPFEWFLPEYVGRGSRVVEQRLNFSQKEARKMLSLLQTEALPQNRRYRYNYVKDNCGTRILDRIDDAASLRVRYPDSVAYGCFRNEMRAYHKGYPWYQFGIDLALGSGIDHPATGRDEMFVPVEMMKKMSGASFSDGRPLVAEERVLYEGNGHATLPPTPWFLTPLFWSCVALSLAVALACRDLRRGRVTRWAYALWFTILGLAGTLVAFLVFISSHEATSPNALILWLNPLQLVMAVCVCVRRLRGGAVAMAYYNIAATVCTLIVWPFQGQSANPAFFPLLGATLTLAVAYAIIAHKESYNNKGGTRKRSVTSSRKAGPVAAQVRNASNSNKKRSAK